MYVRPSRITVCGRYECQVLSVVPCKVVGPLKTDVITYLSPSRVGAILLKAQHGPPVSRDAELVMCNVPTVGASIDGV